MSLPTEIDLPLMNEQSEDFKLYQKDLVFEIQNMYESIVGNVNGFIRNSTEIDQAQWNPTLAGTGGGSFTYVSQVGWSIRQGIFTRIWFDIEWSATTATGNLYIELPYKASLSNKMPFVGTVMASNVAYSGDYLVINAIPDTYRGEFYNVTTAAPTSNLTVPTSGRLIGYIDYIGVEDE